MIKTVISKPGDKLTEDELRKFEKEVAEAKRKPIVFDEDCPELSPAMMKAFRCAAVQRNRRNNA